MIRDFVKLEEIIKPILTENERTRSDDMYLYYAYLQFKRVYDIELVFKSFDYRKRNRIAPFESVRRVRQKLQAKYPSLASEETKKARAKEEEIYKEYARE